MSYPDLNTLPVRVDFRQGAELVSRYRFPVSHRSLERWGLHKMRVNGRNCIETAQLFAKADAKLAAAQGASPWVPPEIAAARIGVSVATLWRGVADGRISPPAYPSEKTPRFHLDVLDADMSRARAKPSENEAGRRAARLAEARQRARAARPAAEEPTAAAQV